MADGEDDDWDASCAALDHSQAAEAAVAAEVAGDDDLPPGLAKGELELSLAALSPLVRAICGYLFSLASAGARPAKKQKQSPPAQQQPPAAQRTPPACAGCGPALACRVKPTFRTCSSGYMVGLSCTSCGKLQALKVIRSQCCRELPSSDRLEEEASAQPSAPFHAVQGKHRQDAIGCGDIGWVERSGERLYGLVRLCNNVLLVVQDALGLGKLC